MPLLVVASAPARPPFHGEGALLISARVIFLLVKLSRISSRCRVRSTAVVGRELVIPVVSAGSPVERYVQLERTCSPNRANSTNARRERIIFARPCDSRLLPREFTPIGWPACVEESAATVADNTNRRRRSVDRFGYFKQTVLLRNSRSLEETALLPGGVATLFVDFASAISPRVDTCVRRINK